MAANKHSSDLINVVISNNSILFEEETEDRGSDLDITYVAGISLDRPTNIQNVVIANNTISKSPGFGISVGTFTSADISIANVAIQGNTIVDAGHYKYGSDKRKVFIELRSLLNNITVRDNMILDTYSKTRAKAAVRAKALTNGSTNVKVRENLIYATGALENDLVHTVKTYPDHLELVSPNNRRFKLVVDDAGKMTTERI